MPFTSCANDNHDATTFEIDGMVENIKISNTEHDFSFPKKILNCVLRTTFSKVIVPSSRNQSFDLESVLINWVLYDRRINLNDTHREKVYFIHFNTRIH